MTTDMMKLTKAVSECVKELDSINVPHRNSNTTYSVNYRAEKRWGQCVYLPNGNCEINISYHLLADNCYQGLKQTIIHELLHTATKGEGHKGMWQYWAGIVNRELGYDVSRTNSAESLNIDTSQIEHKYTVRCKVCGYEVHKDRKCRIINYPSYFNHRNCGGIFERVK